MKLPLLIMIGTCFAMMIVTPLLVALAMLALPGRKGRMRTVREVFHAGVDADATRTLYAERLGYDGFVLSPAAADPASLEATKPKRPTADAAVGAHADKSLSVRLDFAPDPARRGVHVRATAWVNDFIFYDTGEGRLIDAMLDRLLRADLDKEPRPVVPNVSFMALSAMVTAALCIAISLALPWLFPSRDVRLAAVVAGLGLAACGAISVARQSGQDIRRRPAELTGAWMVTATMVIGAVAVIVVIAVLYQYYGHAIAELTRPRWRGK